MLHENDHHSSGQLTEVRLGCKVIEPGQEPRIQHVCNHQEQDCTRATEGYARTSGLVVVNVTIGPGGINALNGVFGAWADSIPMLVVSGQVKHKTCMYAQSTSGLRQFGDEVTVRGFHA